MISALKEFRNLHEGWVETTIPYLHFTVGFKGKFFVFSNVPGLKAEFEAKMLTYLACYSNGVEVAYIFQGKESYVFWVYNTPPNAIRVEPYNTAVMKQLQQEARRLRESPNAVREPYRALQDTLVEQEPKKGYYVKWDFNRDGKKVV